MTQCDCKLMTLSVAVLLPGCLAWLCTSLWPREHGGSGQWPERPVTHSLEWHQDTALWSERGIYSSGDNRHSDQLPGTYLTLARGEQESQETQELDTLHTLVTWLRLLSSEHAQWPCPPLGQWPQWPELGQCDGQEPAEIVITPSWNVQQVTQKWHHLTSSAHQQHPRSCNVRTRAPVNPAMAMGGRRGGAASVLLLLTLAINIGHPQKSFQSTPEHKIDGEV